MPLIPRWTGCCVLGLFRADREGAVESVHVCEVEGWGMCPCHEGEVRELAEAGFNLALEYYAKVEGETPRERHPAETLRWSAGG